jgi:hypothetical protein
MPPSHKAMAGQKYMAKGDGHRKEVKKPKKDKKK